MTALTPPPGVEAREPVRPGDTVDWEIASPSRGRLQTRIRDGHIVLRTAPLATLTLGSDPTAIRRFAWLVHGALYRLADVLEAGQPEPEPDPQLTIDDVLAEVEA